MNANQLNSARLARWSQNGEARLTLEAAAEWLKTIGFCPYLPIGPNGGAPSASFLEAVVGRPAQAPSAGERSRALELLARLIANSSAVPLKLGNSLGEQPDFVASEDVLRYVYALRGDRNFKAGPSTVGNEKVTPLAQHCWQAMQDQGPLDVAALQPILGRDITEAAIARALQELWQGLYAFPVLSASGGSAQWELLARRFPQQVAAGARTGQAEAQSALISLYLHAAVAAAEEEVLAFLSPLAAQSKLREVVRGLGSMRQLDIIDIDGRSHVCLQGGLLPEMVAQLSELQLAASSMQPELEIEPAPQEAPREPQQDKPRPQQPWRPRPQGDSEEGRRFTPKKFVPKKFAARNPESRERSEFRDRSGPRTGAGSGDGFRSAGPGTGPRTGQRPGGAYSSRPRTFAARGGDGPGGRGFDARSKSTRGPGERAKRWEKSGEARLAGDRPVGDRKPYASKSSGFAKPSFGYKKTFASKSSGFKPAGSRPWASKDASAGASTERPKRWEKSGPGGRAIGDRPASDRKSYAPKSFGSKSSGFKPGGFKSTGFKPAGSRPWASKPGGSKFGASRPWSPRPSSDAEGSGAAGREQGERPKRWEKSGTGAKPAGRKPFAAKSSGGKPWVSKGGASKGASSRVGSARSYAARSAGKPFEKFDKMAGRKPWAKRASSDTGEAGVKPKRRERSDASSEKPSGEKRNAKPFWAKNPRGGKGSAAASRTNRPHGKKKGGKKK